MLTADEAPPPLEDFGSDLEDVEAPVPAGGNSEVCSLSNHSMALNLCLKGNVLTQLASSSHGYIHDKNRRISHCCSDFPNFEACFNNVDYVSIAGGSMK